MNKPCHIAVVGSGAAGLAAAISAARAGRSTLLLDRGPGPGGTGGFSGLTTLCGLYDDDGRFLNGGLAREFAEALGEAAPVKMGKVWVLPYRPEKFREVAALLLATTPNLETRWNTPLVDVIVEDSRIARLNGVPIAAVIDCTGTAEVARAIGADCLSTDETTQAPAVVFPLRNVTGDLTTPAAVAQVLLPLARAGWSPLSFQPTPEPGAITVKFTGSPGQVPSIIDFLRKNAAGFEHCRTPLTEFIPARRAGRMIIGHYILTGADVLGARQFPDAVARCAWPVEQWNADGVAHFRYLPPGTSYDIPARSLQAARVGNLFMAGKSLSADVDAIASARVMGCCLATGAAAGQLAARSLEGLSARA